MVNWPFYVTELDTNITSKFDIPSAVMPKQAQITKHFSTLYVMSPTIIHH